MDALHTYDGAIEKVESWSAAVCCSAGGFLLTGELLVENRKGRRKFEEWRETSKTSTKLRKAQKEVVIYQY